MEIKTFNEQNNEYTEEYCKQLEAEWYQQKDSEDEHFVDTSRLPIRILIKGYKKICEILGEEEKSTKGKKYQKENWSRFFSWIEVTCYKYYVTEIYDQPRPYKENPRNTIEYIPLLKELIVDYVCNRHFEYKKLNQITVSPYVLFEALKMVHTNFKTGRNNHERVAQHEKLNKMNTKISFDYIHNQLKTHTEKALDELYGEGAIHWDKPYWITQFDDNVLRTFAKDKYGIEYIRFTKNDYDVPGDKQPATEEQVKWIEECEQESLDYLSCDNEGEVIRQSLWNEYKEYTFKLLFEKYKIGFYWSKYFIHVQEGYEDRIPDDEVDSKMEELHEMVNERLINNFTNRQSNRTKKIISEFEAELQKPHWGKANPFDKEELDRSIKFIEQQLEAFEQIIHLYMYLDAEDKSYLGFRK